MVSRWYLRKNWTWWLVVVFMFGAMRVNSAVGGKVDTDCRSRSSRKLDGVTPVTENWKSEGTIMYCGSGTHVGDLRESISICSSKWRLLNWSGSDSLAWDSWFVADVKRTMAFRSDVLMSSTSKSGADSELSLAGCLSCLFNLWPCFFFVKGGG